MRWKEFPRRDPNTALNVWKVFGFYVKYAERYWNILKRKLICSDTYFLKIILAIEGKMH